MPDEPFQYIQMVRAQSDAQYGKLEAGRIMRVDNDRANRWITAGIAEKSDEGAYTKFREARAETISNREGAFSALNRDDRAALWDVSTHRDALSAPEAGLRAAVEAGIPLVNLGALRTPEGLPLDPEASIEEILEARNNLHPDAVGVLTAHERASTSGGGSHYDMPMPLNPALREQERAIREQERNAQSDAYRAEQDKPTSTESPPLRQGQAGRRATSQHAQQAHRVEHVPADQAQRAEPKE